MDNLLDEKRLSVCLATALEASFATPGVDWNVREQIAYGLLASGPHTGNPLPADLFLGGDLLRPYLAIRVNNEVWFVSKGPRDASVPRLLRELDEGRFGTPRSPFGLDVEDGYTIQVLSGSKSIEKRLLVPNVHLISLTDGSRYQSRRYPLNIGRLAQWLRFQHAGRVKVGDLALNYGGVLKALSDELVSTRPDVLGISLNFGELEELRLLMTSLRAAEFYPIVCLGNVLAAWEPAEVVEACKGFSPVISYSYGEADLEELCLSFREKNTRSRTASLKILTDRETRGEHFPSALVFPDEGLLASTLAHNGQSSIETSFGCQYGRCSFCPRDHRGNGWRRPQKDAALVIDKLASLVATLSSGHSHVLSIVDEDAFGEEGIHRDTGCPSIVGLVKSVGSHGLLSEIYTRLEQLFDRSVARPDSIERLRQLVELTPSLARVFVGVESGCDSQLRRYAKGQTTQDIVDALRAGSLLGLPLEFGFITFDPLLTVRELVENIEFLARTDILLQSATVPIPSEIDSLVRSDPKRLPTGRPVFSRVAYMATELELFVNSSFLKRLTRTHPQLIGPRDDTFARVNYRYEDPVIEQIASWCRVWTEGTFRPIYRMRLASRASRDLSNAFHEHTRRYREATFGFLLALTARFSEGDSSRLRQLANELSPEIPLVFDDAEIHLDELPKLWEWIISDFPLAGGRIEAEFDLKTLERRRES